MDMRRAIIYACVSPGDHRPTRIGLQIAQCRAYCATHGYAVSVVIYDRDGDGPVLKRAAMQRLLAELDQTHAATTVVTLQPDHISQNHAEVTDFAIHATRAGGTVEFVDPWGAYALYN